MHVPQAAKEDATEFAVRTVGTVTIPEIVRLDEEAYVAIGHGTDVAEGISSAPNKVHCVGFALCQGPDPHLHRCLPAIVVAFGARDQLNPIISRSSIVLSAARTLFSVFASIGRFSGAA